MSTSIPPAPPLGDGSWRFEIRRVLVLALPVMIAQVGSMLLGTVDTMMVGRIGEDALAAAALGNAWFYAVLLVGQGVVHGIDPLVTQAHGARDAAGTARALQRGVVVAVVASVPLCFVLAFTGDVLLWSGQEPELAALAHEYIWVQIPSLPFFLLFMAVRQYLQGRELMRPGMWVMAFANIGNLVFNRVLIFGAFGVPALGLFGAGTLPVEWAASGGEPAGEVRVSDAGEVVYPAAQTCVPNPLFGERPTLEEMTRRAIELTGGTR